MNTKLSILILILSFVFSACKKEEKFSDQAEKDFFLENKGAIMPVQVRGNTKSKVFVVVMHGGPGDSGTRDFGDTGIFKTLEGKYAMVYYDQRCAGLSQGSCDPKNLTVQDYVDDIDKLLQVLESIYGMDISFFLLGHSWGATLGLDYLINGASKSKIKGYIQSDGSHNIPKLFVEQKDILLFYADQQINAGNKITEWQEIKDNVINADPTVQSDQILILQKTYETEKLFEAVDSIQNYTPANFTFSNYLRGFLPVAITSNLNNDFTAKLFSYDITNKLPQISTPIALLWGKLDLVHPPNMAIDIFNNLGSTDKSLYFFQNSFHSPFANESEEYQLKVYDFIQAHL